VDQINATELKRLLARHRLKLAAVGTGAGWLVRKLSLTNPKARVRQDAEQFISAIIDFAAGFGAPAIIGSMQGRIENGVSRGQALEWLREALNRLGQRAGSAGVPLLIEPLNRYETNVLNCVTDGINILKSLKTKNVKLLCDLFHMNIEEPSIPQALLKAGKRLGHVHWADSNRQAMGFGHTETAALVKTLRALGYSGFISAEVLALPNPEDAARQTIRSFRHCFKTY
jgi:sugar phosphate isomerase/epimerase